MDINKYILHKFEVLLHEDVSDYKISEHTDAMNFAFLALAAMGED